MWSPVGYSVVRTTTDKLEEVLNGFSEGWEVEQITHTGGRDWVVIAAHEFDSGTERQSYAESLGY